MAQKSGGDKVTRNIVIAMVTLVVAVGVIFSVMGNKASNSVSLPSQANSTNGNGVEFNGDLTGVPVVNVHPITSHLDCNELQTIDRFTD